MEVEVVEKTKKYFKMKLLFVLCMALFSSCKSSPDHRSQLILDFTDLLKQEEVSVDMLQSKYFSSEKFKESESKYGHYLLILSSLKDEINKSSKVEVLPYQEAIGQELNVYRIDDKPEDVYVILLKDKKGGIFNKTYCLMKGDKIQSLSVLRKDQIVIGWN